MLMDSAVKKSFDGEERYDKFVIAGALLGMSFNGASCSLIESQVPNNCQSCNLRYIYKKVVEIVEDYTNKTTVTSSSFSFGK